MPLVPGDDGDHGRNELERLGMEYALQAAPWEKHASRVRKLDARAGGTRRPEVAVAPDGTGDDVHWPRRQLSQPVQHGRRRQRESRPGCRHSTGDVLVSDGLREILLTVSPAQFDALAEDLMLLREHGADSNTQAIIDAVRDRADRIRVASAVERRAAA
jgi:hypothetical protein